MATCFDYLDTTMISGVKRFGSYVRQEFDEESARPKRAANTSANELLSNCAIPSSYIELKLLSVSPYNHDCSFFEFSLPEGHTELRLPIGSHLLVHIPAVDERGDAVCDAMVHAALHCVIFYSGTAIHKRIMQFGKKKLHSPNQALRRVGQT